MDHDRRPSGFGATVEYASRGEYRGSLYQHQQGNLSQQRLGQGGGYAHVG